MKISDEIAARLGRRLLREAAEMTKAGKYAAQIGEILYNTIGGPVKTAVEKKNYEDVVIKLTEIQGYLEEIAVNEAREKLGIVSL